MIKFGFTSQETRAVAGISSLYFLRIIGLFLLYPVLAVYAAKLPNSTPLLIGLALGIYGLAQALFQIPFGTLSDRLGRKPMIALGLLIFALGSLVAASFETMTGLILGRLLQGAGAISAVCVAMVGDLIEAPRRSKAMACIGITIGLAFSLSLVLGPVLVVRIGLSGLFYLLAILALLALCVLYLAIPAPQQTIARQSVLASLKDILGNPAICRITFSITVLHAALAAMFMIVPLEIIALTGSPLGEHVFYYLVGILLTFVFVFPALGLVERRQWHHRSVLLAIICLTLATLLLGLFHAQLIIFFVALALFFLAFNFLEASLPALMTRVAPKAYRGAAMGFYSTCQFFGIFLGGIVGGIVLNYGSAAILYFVLMGMMVLWLIVYNYN